MAVASVADESEVEEDMSLGLASIFDDSGEVLSLSTFYFPFLILFYFI